MRYLNQDVLTTLSGAKSIASSPSVVLSVKSASSFRRATAVSPIQQILALNLADLPKEILTHTVTLRNSMMKRGEAFIVRRVQGAPVLQQQHHHGHGPDGCGAMDGVLAAAVTNAG